MALPTSMQAVVLTAPGGVENLHLTTLPLPLLAAGEVLVRVHALSINPVDTYIRREPSLAFVFNGEQPMILGWDISGTVAAVGQERTGFAVGDEVFGSVKFPEAGRPGHAKGYADYVAAPAAHLARKPANVSHAEAAAATTAALTAYQPLRQADIRPGDKVFITAAGGGVGHYAIQLAKSFGAYVIALASGAKRGFVLGLGADEHVDYQTQRFEEVVSGVDVALEAVRGAQIARTLTVLRPGGRLISLFEAVAGTPLAEQAHALGVEAAYSAVHSSGADMQAIAGLLATGQVRSAISHTFPLAQMAAAHQQMEQDNAQGKIIITLF